MKGGLPGLSHDFLDVEAFSRIFFPSTTLRDYQIRPARAIVRSVHHQLGEQHAVVFSRQAGKDEMLAQIVAQLLVTHAHHGGSILLVAPTLKPQGMLMRDRLVDRLKASAFQRMVRTREGSIVEVGSATARFLSASPLANVRGQTASLLLVANEAQDIQPDIWNAVFDPMAATTNATTVFMGTVWNRKTLLARQMRYLDSVETGIGGRRVWKVAWGQVAEHLPAYGERVRDRIAQLGADHPHIRTEYFLEELDDAGALFKERHIAQMQGDHPRQNRAEPGNRYALLIDVAGEAERPVQAGEEGDRRARDRTALTVVQIVDPDGVELLAGLPEYRVVDRMFWSGAGHALLHRQIVDLCRHVWKASAVVIDATGIGAGLSSFLKAELSQKRGSGSAIRVVPFVFTGPSKSALGWDFLALIESGRYKEYRETAAAGSAESMATHAFWSELRSIEYEVLTGPGMTMRWSAPGRSGHDDLVMSAAMTAALDGIDWRPRVARGTW